jgi:hypothetical protein
MIKFLNFTPIMFRVSEGCYNYNELVYQYRNVELVRMYFFLN